MKGEDEPELVDCPFCSQYRPCCPICRDTRRIPLTYLDIFKPRGITAIMRLWLLQTHALAGCGDTCFMLVASPTLTFARKLAVKERGSVAEARTWAHATCTYLGEAGTRVLAGVVCSGQGTLGDAIK